MQKNITGRRNMFGKPSQKNLIKSNGFTTPSHGTKGPLWNMGHQQPCHFDPSQPPSVLTSYVKALYLVDDNYPLETVTEDIGYYDYRPVTLLIACFISFQSYALS